MLSARMHTHTHTHTHTPLPHPLLPQDFFPPESACLALFSVGALFPTPASRVVLSASWELKIPPFFFFWLHQVLVLACRI